MPTLKKFRCHIDIAWVDACVLGFDTRFIASQCSHAHRHQSIRGTKDSSEYPPALAQALASVFAPKLTSLGHRLASARMCCSSPSQPESLPRAPVCDGAGRHSSADRTLHWLQSSGLRASIAAHIIQQKPDCPLSEAQEQEALSIILATRIDDKDTALIPMLRAGVTTGVHDPIPSSLQWPRKAQPHQELLALEMCEGNWSAAEAKPAVFKP